MSDCEQIVPFIAQPLHSPFGVHYLASHGLWQGATQRAMAVVSSPGINSVLPDNFNCLLCSAMNRRSTMGVTHFAMLHGDIVPQVGWLDVLYDEMIATGADLISAIVPIKNHEGLTSTAIGRRTENGRPEHVKLTMRDVFALPESFTVDDTPWANTGRALLINTGLMLFDIRKPWVSDFLRDGGFGFETWCDELPDGTWKNDALSEDWRLSLWMHEHNLKVVATRKVKLRHFGTIAYSNDEPWGVAPMNEQLKPQAANV